MFSSSFTMSEQEHRQWTPYKHAAPALTGRFALARPAARSARASTEICARPSKLGERAARKQLRGNQNTAQHALPQERKRAKTQGGSNYAAWITVRHPARCAAPNCQTQINPGERGFYYPGDKALYGSRCGHGEKAERDFAEHRIDEDSY